MSKFKIGDRVVWGGDGHHAADSGVITREVPDSWTRGTGWFIEWDSDGSELWLDEECLSPEPSKYVIKVGAADGKDFMLHRKAQSYNTFCADNLQDAYDEVDALNKIFPEREFTVMALVPIAKGE